MSALTPTRSRCRSHARRDIWSATSCCVQPRSSRNALNRGRVLVIADLLDRLARLRSLSYLLDEADHVLIVMFSETTTSGDYQKMREIRRSSAWPDGWDADVRKGGVVIAFEPQRSERCPGFREQHQGPLSSGFQACVLTPEPTFSAVSAPRLSSPRALPLNHHSTTNTRKRPSRTGLHRTRTRSAPDRIHAGQGLFHEVVAGVGFEPT
jgi:hypothetical protein